MAWQYTGFVRIHFNRKDEAPLLAAITSVDHSWEMLAKEVRIEPGDGALVSSSDLTNARPGLDPIWWLTGYCEIKVDEAGLATITPLAL